MTSPSVIDFDDGEISVRLDGKELRGWSYASDDERRQKMLQAREYVEGWGAGHAHISERTSDAPAVDDANMVKISGLISTLQGIKDRFGDTCVYIRRGGLSWGAVALNRQDDDRKHGVFDLQAQHDRDMLQRAEQVERLKASRNAAESRLCQIRDASHKGSMTPAERLQDIRLILDRVSSPVTEDRNG